MTGELLHEAAKAMRADHGPEHERHAMWSAMADLLDAEAATQEQYPDRDDDDIHNALAVARTYLDARRAT